MKQEIISENAPKPIGPYSQAIKKENMLFLSGQIAIDSITGNLKTSNIKEETNLVLSNISALIDEAGFNKRDIIKATIFIKNMDQFKEINEVYSAFFAESKVYPARETVEVSRLPKDVNIEISIIAIR